MTPRQYTITIVEPSQLICEGLQALIGTSGGFEVSRCFDSYEAFAAHESELLPIDILIINAGMLCGSGGDPLPYPPKGVAVVGLLYAHLHHDRLAHLDALIDIYDNREQVIRKLERAVGGSKAQDKSGNNNEAIELSEREVEILVSVTQGCTNKEMAERHGISIHTVISHRKNITRKTGIKTVSGLTIYAIFNGLISQDNLGN